MKKALSIIFLLIYISTSLSIGIAFAQKDNSGIYRNGDDFAKGKLSLAINCKTEKHKIKLNDFFSLPYIIVKHNDSSYKLYKKDIFGYKMCDGSVYRFDNKKELLLLNPTEQILIYKHIIAKPPTGLNNVTNYYFSLGSNSPVKLLTKSNLKAVFPGYNKFYESLNTEFKYNTQLAKYDDNHKIFRLNWLYQNNNN